MEHKGDHFDVLVIGAGPTGMACAIEAQCAGFTSAMVDKGCLVNSLFHYPANMVFFTTPELLEIGDIPFTTANQKPNRSEALEYYRNVAQHYRLDVRQYQRVASVTGYDGAFRIETQDLHGHDHEYVARKIVVATGYYDRPNYLGIPGEDLPKVMHYYKDPHPYFDMDVLIIGAKNSASIAALELWRRGSRVTMVHRGADIHRNVKYWIKPDIENRIKNGEVTAYFNSCVLEIRPEEVRLKTPDGERMLKNDFVFALTGYHPDYQFLESVGIELTRPEMRPVCDPLTFESNVPGIYVAGVVVSGARTSEIFIENGRFHGKQIADDLKTKLQVSRVK
ncbi:MAG TPA: YpdA family putative bacillithiol disulfide reductase [Candidatus Polarisedimenticolia bacterium]|jgi:thioredoxin reductase (NADPH)|nr:YpdA family putative bacillithiol disulfide reductase [Candidatus Polarisedimenticolia bacterium]